MSLLVLLLCVCAYTLSQQVINGVLILEQKTFFQTLNEFPKMVVYFNAPNCVYCQQFDITYSMLANQYFQKSKDVQFGKISYGQNKKIFAKYNISEVPQVRVFEGGKMLQYVIDHLYYEDTSLYHAFVERAFTKLPKGLISSQSILIRCESKFAGALNERRRRELSLAFGCSDEIAENLLMITDYPYSWRRQAEGQRDEDYETEVVALINLQIDRMKYIYVYEWSEDYVAELYKRHQDMFILITNNESVSNATYGSYLRIREEWSTLAQYSHYPLLRFVVADLARDLQATTQVRRELTGTLISDRKEYSYPLLGFLHYNLLQHRVQRYLFPVDAVPSYPNLLTWMNNVMEVAVLHTTIDPLKQPSHFNHTIEEWFLHDPDENQPELDINFTAIEPYMVSMDFKRYKEAMTSSMENPFFVFIMWKNYQASLNVFNFLRKLWADEDRIGPLMSFYYLVRNVDQFPPIKQLQVQFFPALLHIDKQKKVSVLEGVTNRDRIIQFITDHAGKIEMKSKSTKQKKKNSKSSSKQT